MLQDTNNVSNAHFEQVSALVNAGTLESGL